MRILLTSSSSGSRGGGEFFLVYLGEALQRLGAKPALWIADDPQMDELANLFKAFGPVIRHPYINTYLRSTRSFSHLLPNRKEMAEIVASWNTFSPDIIHLNKQCLEDGLDLLSAASGQATPHGCTIHITQTALELNAFCGRLRDRLAKGSLKKYSGELWAISSQRAKELGKFIGKDHPVPFIPNGVKIPDEKSLQQVGMEMRKRLFGNSPQVGPVAVGVGRLEEQKNPFRFLEILEVWKAIEPGLKGIWVGDGSLRETFEERIHAMSAGDWISCVGWQDDAIPYLSMADVYVHPARFEGLPFALLEAMAHGLPCVLSPSLANELKDDMPEDTWIIAGEDSTKWLEKLSDRQYLESKGKHSRNLIKDKFSIEAMAQAYLKLYESSISNWRKAGR